MPESRLPRLQGPGGELARLMLVQLFLNACLTGTRMAAPLQALRLGHGEAAVGGLIALFALAQVFLALPAGRYCERHGLRRPVVRAVAVAMAGCAIAAAWPVFPVRWALWRDPGLRRLLVVTCLLSSCWDVHAFLVPVLGHERGFAASAIGSILGAFGIAAAAVRLLAPLIAARVREWTILFGAMAATAILFAFYPLMHAPLAMGVGSAVLGFTLGSTQPMVMSLLHQLAPEHRYGEAVAMRLIVNNASSISIPMVSGLAGSLVGAGAVFWAAGLMAGAGARLALGLKAAEACADSRAR